MICLDFGARSVPGRGAEVFFNPRAGKRGGGPKFPEPLSGIYLLLLIPFSGSYNVSPNTGASISTHA